MGYDQLNYIIGKLDKASYFGVSTATQPKKMGQKGGRVSIQTKGPLNSTEFSCVKKCFDEAFNAGMDQRFGNVDVIKGICHLLICANDKRVEQFALAFTNSLMETHNPVAVAEGLKRGIQRFQDTTQPQLKTSGVQALLNKIDERVERTYGEAA